MSIQGRFGRGPRCCSRSKRVTSTWRWRCCRRCKHQLPRRQTRIRHGLLAGALGRTEILMLKIPKKPDLSIRNRYGGNALIPACERGHVETVKLLLTTDINVDHVNNLGWNLPS